MIRVAMIGGPPTQASEGWLKPMFPITGMAHYFEKEFELSVVAVVSWQSLCGLDAISSEKIPMFEAGNWTRCKKCARRLERRSA